MQFLPQSSSMILHQPVAQVDGGSHGVLHLEAKHNVLIQSHSRYWTMTRQWNGIQTLTHEECCSK